MNAGEFFKYALMIFVMTFSGTLGAVFFKRASSAMQISKPWLMLLNWSLYAGGMFYLLGAVMNILLLRQMEYSILYPMTSLTYIWTMFVSALVFHEKITKQKVIALCCIIAGIVILNI